MTRLTARQWRVFVAVVNGAHTLGDLTSATGLAKSTCVKALERLEAAGLVTWERNRQGTLRALVHAVRFTSEAS